MNSVNSSELVWEDEWVDSLECDGLNIIMSRSLPRFTSDAVLLEKFCRVGENDRVLDMGSGTGVISLLLYGRTKAKITGMEIQKELCSLMRRSVELNDLNNEITVINIDFCEAYKQYNCSFDVVVCNPPYFIASESIVSDNVHRAVSRTQSEDNCTLDSVMLAVSRLLRSGGKFFVCYPANKLPALFSAMQSHRLEPKRICFVRSNAKKPPYLVLVEAKKDGGSSLVYDADIVL